jgi:hypothetical protein
MDLFLTIWERLKKATQDSLPTRWLCLTFITEASKNAIKECIETDSESMECQVLGEAELEDLDKAQVYAHPIQCGTGRIAVIIIQTKGMFTTHPVNYQKFYTGWKKLVPNGKVIWRRDETKVLSCQEVRVHARMGLHPFREEIYPFMFFRPLAQDYLDSLNRIKGGLSELKDVDNIKFKKHWLDIDAAIIFSGFHVLTMAMLSQMDWLRFYRITESRYITSVVLEQTADVLGRYGFKRQLQAAKHGTEGIPFLRWECV